MMTGAQAMSTPTPGRPRRSSKMPRMGAANVTMKLPQDGSRAGLAVHALRAAAKDETG
jgi:hypothetical protein